MEEALDLSFDRLLMMMMMMMLSVCGLRLVLILLRQWPSFWSFLNIVMILERTVSVK